MAARTGFTPSTPPSSVIASGNDFRCGSSPQQPAGSGRPRTGAAPQPRNWKGVGPVAETPCGRWGGTGGRPGNRGARASRRHWRPRPRVRQGNPAIGNKHLYCCGRSLSRNNLHSNKKKWKSVELVSLRGRGRVQGPQPAAQGGPAGAPGPGSAVGDAPGARTPCQEVQSRWRRQPCRGSLPRR